MCGIAGFACWNRPPHRLTAEAWNESLTKAAHRADELLRHRGPDGSGRWRCHTLTVRQLEVLRRGERDAIPERAQCGRRLGEGIDGRDGPKVPPEGDREKPGAGRVVPDARRGPCRPIQALGLGNTHDLVEQRGIRSMQVAGEKPQDHVPTIERQAPSHARRWSRRPTAFSPL